MKAVAVIDGQVRGRRDLYRRGESPANGHPFAREVSVLTKAGPVLGETLKIVVFLEGPAPAMLDPEDYDAGCEITWAVDLDASAKYGLSATFRADLALAPVAA